MLRFARPRSLSPLTWWHETDPVRFKNLCDYCALDVLAERELDRRVPELSQRERLIFELDHWINQEGLGIDHLLVERTGGTDPGRPGPVDPWDRRSDQGPGALAQPGRSATRLAHASRCRDPGPASWHGAGPAPQDPSQDPPGRRCRRVSTPAAHPPLSWLPSRLCAPRTAGCGAHSNTMARQGPGAGREGGFQPQNLFRGSIKDVPAALDVIRAGAGPEDLELLFEDSALGVVASCMRSTIVARPGHRLVIADFSQIEARVLAWLAGQKDALKHLLRKARTSTSRPRAPSRLGEPSARQGSWSSPAGSVWGTHGFSRPRSVTG